MYIVSDTIKEHFKQNHKRVWPFLAEVINCSVKPICLMMEFTNRYANDDYKSASNLPNQMIFNFVFYLMFLLFLIFRALLMSILLTFAQLEFLV